jgi:hypothetical protein
LFFGQRSRKAFEQLGEPAARRAARSVADHERSRDWQGALEGPRRLELLLQARRRNAFAKIGLIVTSTQANAFCTCTKL